MLPPAHRLRRGTEIRQVRRAGHRRSHPLLLLFAKENDGRSTRFAISVGARIGNAVVRNRVRRRIREAVRFLLPAVQPGWDCLFVVREEAAKASFSELMEAVRTLLARNGILNGHTTE